MAAHKDDGKKGGQGMFSCAAQWVSHQAGRPPAFITAFLTVIVWAVTGPIFGYSETWQLVINTGTTIVTFLMVFLIQNSQNRDTQAIQLKLDELIRANVDARNAMLGLDEMSDEELEKLRKDYLQLAEKKNVEPEEISPAGRMIEQEADRRQLDERKKNKPA